MKILATIAAAAVVLTGAPAVAQHTTVHRVHGPMKLLPHHRVKVCQTKYVDHHRVTRCHYRR